MKKKIAMLLSAVLLATSMIPGMQQKQQRTVHAEETTDEQSTDINKLLDMNEMYGWASVAGEGIQGTTGGGNATPQVVTTFEEFQQLVTGDIPAVVVVSGTINVGGYGTLIGKNKTIVGIDKNATIYGGLRINDSNNVIVSNLNIQGTWPNGGPDDCIEVKTSHHVWLNHLNIWDSTDGNLDITYGSNYITVSWCKFWYSKEAKDGVDPEHDHRLSCLIGSGAGDHDDTDMDKLKVTYHHNWFADLLDQRMPRVMYGRSHIYNNYYTCEGNTYCIGADSYASILVENNYFKNVNNPHEFSYDPGLPSCIVARGNEYDNTTGSKTTGQHQETSIIKPFEKTVYDYYLNDAADIPNVITAFAGPQFDLSGETKAPDAYNNGELVKGVSEEEDNPMPSVDPLPTLKPANTLNDNPITYDEDSKTYTYHGQNSNRSNAYFTIDNPFKGYNFREDNLTFTDGHPDWTKGATISYWVKVPEKAADAAVLNFNLENKRQMDRNDAVKYKYCQEYSESDPSYSMGEQKTYVDAAGNEYTVLSGYGKNVCYNPGYPKDGCYEATTDGGAIQAYEKGTDSTKKSNWLFLNFIGNGYYENYSVKFDEEGGSKSRIKEAKISGSLSLYASGTMGYRQDNYTGLQMNPFLSNYGQVLDVQQYNQFYYWGNSSTVNFPGGSLTPTMEEKDTWHFVVAVIQNNWIQYYMDGKEMTIDYLSWWGKTVNVNTASKGFNYGCGHKLEYRMAADLYSPNAMGMTILDFISDEDTVLTIGGMGAGAARIGQEKIGTPNDTQVKDVQFYFTPVDAKNIYADRIDFNDSEWKLGDVDLNGEVTLEDANLVLKRALKIISFDNPDAERVADVNLDGSVTLEDANKVLKIALKIEK